MKRRTRSPLLVFLALLTIAVAGCSKSDQPEVTTASPQPSASQTAAPSTSSEAARDGAFVCTLLTKEETAAVQGEPFKDAKASQKSSGGLVISQCYFELPTTANSIVLTVTQRAEGADARDPKQNWQELFHRDMKSEKKQEHGPEKIEGLGDEAFWTGSRVGGALYVLKGDRFFRLSVGGGDAREEKIEKSKILAQSALKRL